MVTLIFCFNIFVEINVTARYGDFPRQAGIFPGAAGGARAASPARFEVIMGDTGLNTSDDPAYAGTQKWWFGR